MSMQETRADYLREVEKRPEFNAIHLAAELSRIALSRPEPANPYQVALDATKLFGLGKQLAALSVASCNYGLTDRQEKRREKLAERAQEIASWYGLKADCYGDPRGYVLRLSGPGIKANGFGDGFGVA
jgi:hypothetical protein